MTDPRLKGRAARLWTGYRRLIWAFVAGGAAACVLAGIFGMAVVEFGLYDVAAARQHIDVVSWALHKTFKQSVARSASGKPEPQFSQSQVISGFRQYQADCMMCHGGPGVARAAWVKGLEPTPPYLLDAGNRWTAAELNYILQEGIKMSAMPSWGETRSKEQVWELVAFLKAFPGISPAQFAELQRQYPAGKPAPPSKTR